MIIASRQLSKTLAHNNPGKYNIISIIEPDIKVPREVKEFAKDYLVLSFYDIEYAREDGFQGPTKEHVAKALSWAENKDDLVVACAAGISRSSAIAYLIQCTREPHPKLATGVWRSNHYPNGLIVKLGAELLEDKRILDEYHNWLNRQFT